MRLTPRTHSPEFKLRLCREVAQRERSQAQICREYHLAHSVLERWYRLYRERGEGAFVLPEMTPEMQMKERVAALERLCGQLTLENELLKRGLKLSRSRSDTP
jgi:transposase-like protein